LAILIAIALVALGTLLVTAFGGGGDNASVTTSRLAAGRLLPSGPPTLQIIARLGGLQLSLPHPETAVPGSATAPLEWP